MVHRSTTKRAVVAVVLALLLTVAATACGEESKHPESAAATQRHDAGLPTPPDARSQSLCDNANDYLWWVGFLGSGGEGPDAEALGIQLPQTAPKYEYVVKRPGQLAAALIDQVPADEVQAARTAEKTWMGARGVFAKYSFDPERIPSTIVQQLSAVVGKYEQSNIRYNTWLKSRCDDGRETFPAAPADAKALG